MKIQYAVDQLEQGMYVAELDRPWIGTPFLFQGFMIESDDDLARLKELCKYVFVDDLRSRIDSHLQRKLHGTVRGGAITVEFQEWQGLEKLRETLRRLEYRSDDIVQKLKRLADGAVENQDSQLRDTRQAVDGLIEDIAADPKTGFWMRILTDHDKDSGRHAINVSIMAVGFAAALGWDSLLQSVVGQGALLHDVGMAKVPVRIREKPGTLTQDEFRLVKLHPGYAAGRLEASTELDARVVRIVRHHHERLDGSGYPDGLKGPAIPDYVQLVAICDTYDSYTMAQPFRPALLSSAVLTRLMRRADRHFDKTLVEAFIRWIGIYPLGSVVRLKNGAIGIIISSDATKRLRPTILMLRDSKGRALWPRRTVNLEIVEQAGLSAEWGVQEIVDPAALNIDVRSILLQEIRLR